MEILEFKSIKTKFFLNSLEFLPSRFELEREKTSKLEDKVMEILKVEEQSEKRMKKNEQSLREMWDT